nr:hypothetical protein [uncultured Mediterraneibacter sp.]
MQLLNQKGTVNVMEEYRMPTDVQFKYELRKQLTELNEKLQMLENKEYDKIEKRIRQEIADIEASLQD